MSSGREIVGTLMANLERIDETTDWDPNDINNDSIINLIEVKGMITYAQRKLNKIAKREGWQKNER